MGPRQWSMGLPNALGRDYGQGDKLLMMERRAQNGVWESLSEALLALFHFNNYATLSLTVF